MNLVALRELVELLERTEHLARDLADETFEIAIASQDYGLARLSGRLRELGASRLGAGWRGTLDFYESREREKEPSGETVRSRP